MKVTAALLVILATAQAWALPLPLSTTRVHRTTLAQRRFSALTVKGGADGGELTTPATCFQRAVALGEAKAKLAPSKIFTLGVLSGAHIALGAFLAISVGGSCPMMKANNPGAAKIMTGAFGLPMGLLMTLVAGGELFTGNTAVVTAAVNEGRATGAQLRKSWFWSAFGNVVGSLLIAWLAASAATGVAPAATAIATGKCSATWGAAFSRGLLCNWLVCMAVWMASGADTLVSKAMAVFFPISGFVALGLDHSVANCFMLPFARFLGAELSWGTMLTKNLLPVTLGNIVGGALFVGTGYTKSYGTK